MWWRLRSSGGNAFKGTSLGEVRHRIGFMEQGESEEGC